MLPIPNGPGSHQSGIFNIYRLWREPNEQVLSDGLAPACSSMRSAPVSSSLAAGEGRSFTRQRTTFVGVGFVTPVVVVGYLCVWNR